MKRLTVILIACLVTVLFLTACVSSDNEDDSLNEYDVNVISFEIAEPETEAKNIDLLIVLDSPEGTVSVKFKDIGYEKFRVDGKIEFKDENGDIHAMQGKITISSELSDYGEVVSFSATEVIFFFEDSGSITVTQGEDIKIREISKNIWTITN